MEVLEKQPCPMCRKKTLTLTEGMVEVPFFGKTSIFSMDCANKECNYHKADVESLEQQEPCKYSFDIEEEKDLKTRVIKSSQATVKISHIMTIEPGVAANGYVTNMEGILNRVKNILESQRDGAEDPSAKKKAKNMLKKLQKIMWGQETLKIIIEDPSGNSAIVSEKAVKSKLK